MKKAGKMVEFDQIEEIQRSIKHLVVVNPEFMTYQAAAKYIGKTYGAIRLMIFRGYLTPVINGSYRYLRTSDLDLFMEGKLKNGRQNKRARGSKSSDHGQSEAALDQVSQKQERL